MRVLRLSGMKHIYRQRQVRLKETQFQIMISRDPKSKIKTKNIELNQMLYRRAVPPHLSISASALHVFIKDMSVSSAPIFNFGAAQPSAAALAANVQEKSSTASNISPPLNSPLFACSDFDITLISCEWGNLKSLGIIHFWWGWHA